MQKAIGIDLGGTNMSVGIVDENMEIIGRASRPTHAERPFSAVVDDMHSCAEEAAASCGLSQDSFSCIGVGSPGNLDPRTGVLLNASNLGWHNVRLVEALSKRFQKPVYVANDADCAALGEALAGVARGYESALMVTLGTGVGGGFIDHGKIFRGGDGRGCELGHMVLVPGGRRCTCGVYGCFEAYCSATGLIASTQEAMRRHPESALWKLCPNGIDTVSGKTAFDGTQMGDAVASRVISDYISCLAVGLGSLISILRPHIVTLGGGVSKQKHTLTDPLNEIIGSYVFAAEEAGVPPVVPASLGGDAGIIGAAQLAGHI